MKSRKKWLINAGVIILWLLLLAWPLQMICREAEQQKEAALTRHHLVASVLESLRKGSEHYEQYLEILGKEQQDGHLSLEEMGTTPEKLREFYIKGCAMAAAIDYKRIQSALDPAQADFCRQSMQEEMWRGGLSMEDVQKARAELERRRALQARVPNRGTGGAD